MPIEVDVDELDGRAGVSIRTAKRAIATASKLGLLHRIERRRPGQKSLANELTVVSRELSLTLQFRDACKQRP